VIPIPRGLSAIRMFNDVFGDKFRVARQKEQSLTAAETDTACSIPPRAPHGVTRDSCSIFLASGEQFPSEEPTHRCLRRTLRQSNRLGQFLITHLHGSLSARLFGGEPYIDEEASGSSIMPDQVAHQHIYDVIVQMQHGYTSR
jgi:hypothetical protein